MTIGQIIKGARKGHGRTKRIRKHEPLAPTAIEFPWRDGFEAMIDAYQDATSYTDDRGFTHRYERWVKSKPRRFVADPEIVPTLLTLKAPQGNPLLDISDPAGPRFMGRPITFADAPEMAGRLVLESLS